MDVSRKKSPARRLRQLVLGGLLGVLVLGVSVTRPIADGLGELPLVVLSQGRADPLPGMSEAESEHYEQEWRLMQSELTKLSKNSSHVIATQSGHYIQLKQPQLVVEAARRLHSCGFEWLRTSVTGNMATPYGERACPAAFDTLPTLQRQ